MRRLSIKRQLLVGIVLIAVLSVVCTAATYMLIVHALLHAQLDNGRVRGPIIGAVHFRVEPLARAFRPRAAETIDGMVALFVLTPFLYVALFAYLFAWWFSRGISGPMRALMTAVQKIRSRDLDFTIDTHPSNEIGELLNTFEDMRADLKGALVRQWAMEAERRDLLAAIAHDLRTPLTVIAGQAEMLSDMDALPPPAQRYVHTIQRNAARVVRLLLDFHTVTDLDDPQFALQPMAVDVLAFYAEKVSEYEAIGRSLAIAITASVSDQRVDLDHVLLDVDRVSQVLDNIVTNALRHTPRTGTIACDLAVSEGRITFRVRDEGPGFPPDDLDRVFEKFYRGPAERSRSRGQGLGLYIARELTERMGGRISVANAPGGGGVVTVTVPVTHAVAMPST